MIVRINFIQSGGKGVSKVESMNTVRTSLQEQGDPHFSTHFLDEIKIM